MKTKHIMSIAMLSGALFALPAIAQDGHDGFTALRGIEAQPLSVAEMRQTAGRLNAYDLAAQVLSYADLAKNDRQAAAITARAQAILDNAETINAFYARLGVLTECTSSLCP